ncbi:FxSxx-COOH system tetratricopeptide repeat protein [Streptomyces sp. NPDC047081]|uniref:FxSxx-COOH system tetratricopeptide repeat protein n=1 Tax=Streptomyces sp. NPDC047081 TaxID=3154706 RepID=UPI0034006944
MTAEGHRSVHAHINSGVIVTGDGARISSVTLSEHVLKPAAEVAAPAGVSNLPAPPSPVFVGREDDLALLDAAMGTGSGVITQVVHGLGGVGKSTLALHYAHAHRDRYNPLWWIPSDTAEGTTLALAGLTTALNPAAFALTTEQSAAWARDWLRTHAGWLLIHDNAAEPGALAPLIGALTGGSHLITSRRTTGWDHLARPVPLDVLTPTAAVSLLGRIAGHGVDAPGMGELAAALGWLPLALDQAAAYIRRAAITPAVYLERLRRFPGRMFATPAGGTDREDQTVAGVWRLTVDALPPAARDLLRVLAWLGPEDILRDMLYGSGEGQDETVLDVDDALAQLADYAMVRLTRTGVTVHRLVQAVARTPDSEDPHRSPEAITAGRREATRLLEEAQPGEPLTNVAGWPRWRALLPHIGALASAGEPAHDTDSTVLVLLNAATYLYGQGQISQAIGFAERCVESSVRVHGSDHSDTLTAQTVLALAYASVGDLKRAIPLHERVLDDSRRILGEHHPDTLASLNHLALAYASVGDLVRAIPLHELALTHQEQVHGPDHPDALSCRNNLAAAYTSAGDFARAAALHKRNLAVRERALGPDHPSTLTSRNNLAFTYYSAGDFPRAIALHERNLADRERVLGPDHVDTLGSRDNLAVAYMSAGDLARAAALYERNLVDRERVLGSDHPHTLVSLNHLAYTYLLAGDFTRATPLYERALTDSARVLGPEHPDTIGCHNHLAAAYYAAGDLARAVRLLKRALADCIRAVGEDHATTQLLRANLAHIRRRPPPSGRG